MPSPLIRRSCGSNAYQGSPLRSKLPVLLLFAISGRVTLPLPNRGYTAISNTSPNHDTASSSASQSSPIAISLLRTREQNVIEMDHATRHGLDTGVAPDVELRSGCLSHGFPQYSHLQRLKPTMPSLSQISKCRITPITIYICI